MQMRGICIALIYADVLHMGMSRICLLLSFSGQLRKKVKTDLPIVLPRPAARKHHMWYDTQLTGILYVVFWGQIDSLRPAALDGALLLFPPWYTSGNPPHG